MLYFDDLISKSSSSFTNPLEIVLSAPIKIHPLFRFLFFYSVVWQ